MNKLTKALLLWGIIYAGYKGIDYAGKRAACELQRNRLLQGSNIDPNVIKRMTCEEIRATYIYYFTHRKEPRTEPKPNSTLYHEIQAIRAKYGIFKD